MTKIKAKKKKNLKMRRQIRKTVGALFMASAIVIAALPVQDIEAENGIQPLADPVDTRPAINYDSKYTPPAETDVYNAGTSVYDLPENEYKVSGANLLSAEGREDDIKTSYYLRKVGTEWSMVWQFNYYEVQIDSKTEGAIISKYNNTFVQDDVVIKGISGTEYLEISETKFNSTIAGAPDFILTYEEYISGSENWSNNMRWGVLYRPTFIAQCDDFKERYDAAEKKYNADHDYWLDHKDDSGYTGVEPDKDDYPPLNEAKPSLTLDPTKFTEADKYSYYCYLDTSISGKGDYKLVSVQDSSQGSQDKLLIQAADEKEKSGTDVNGFLLDPNSKTPVVIGIAERAFENISNIKTLSLPDVIYIGDEAFMGSTFLDTVSIPGVSNIGDRAFKNCSELKNVSIDYTQTIGAECFSGTALETIKLPVALKKIGYGAFYNCAELATIDFRSLSVSANCVIEDYAFYNDQALSNLDMENAGINSIGEGAFAVSSDSTRGLTSVKLPNKITGEGDYKLGNLIFANRSNLKYVKFPSQYGNIKAVQVPSEMFRGCSGLETVDFNYIEKTSTTTNGFVNFSDNLFSDVTNDNLCVWGPEKNTNGERANPRQATWKVSTRTLEAVPYRFVDAKGVECYEVCQDGYLLQANANGELTSCELVDTTMKNIPLVIPAHVGSYDITSIREGCFADEKLRKEIVSIEIQDDSVKKIDKEVFAELPKLEKVIIGNSVEEIGEKAFYNCNNLVDVTFHEPKDYKKFTIGTNAFQTNGSELTFNGMIQPGYAPFDFATDAAYEGSSWISEETGVRICYKSLSPDFLTVMYMENDAADPVKGDVVLLDYPKYNELDVRNADHCKDMEDYYYSVYGGAQGDITTTTDDTGKEITVYNENGRYDTLRRTFADKWIAAKKNNEDLSSLYEDSSYGPWIDSFFITQFLAGGFGNTDNITDAPSPYFTKYPYSILTNHKNALEGGNNVPVYKAPTPEEWELINACEIINIPQGVTSIDARKFFTDPKNSNNISAYFGIDEYGISNKSYEMCTTKGENVIPGLFSGIYTDYTEDWEEEDKDLYETLVKGNDRITKVTMQDVRYLPDNAFDSCEKLDYVYLGSKCEDIGNAPFRGCNSLVDVNTTDNPYYDATNRIIYSVNDDGSYTIEECLPTRGMGTSSKIIMTETDPNLTNVSAIREGAFDNCDEISKVDLSDAEKLQIIPKKCFYDCRNLRSVSLPTSVNRIDTDAFGLGVDGNETMDVTIPGKEVHIVSDAFPHPAKNTIYTYRGTSAADYGEYYAHEGMDVQYIDDVYMVEFYDSISGDRIGDIQYVKENAYAVVPEDSKVPVHSGYTFTGWSKDVSKIPVKSNMVIMAQYSNNSATENRHTVIFWTYDGKSKVAEYDVAHEGSVTPPAAPSRSGYKFVAWIPSTYTKVTQDLNIYASYEPGSDSSQNGGNGSGSGSSSPSPTPTASATPEVRKYTVSVSGGSGSGSYPAGAIVAINAYAMSSGQVFDKWTTSTAGVGFADPNATSTTFTMPAANVAITATYKTGDGSGTAAGNGSGSGSGTGSTGTTASNTNSGTVVEVTKPGISSAGLAGATVTGATDNFIVKVTEDQAATDAAIAALQARYGDLSRIKYFPMDISLYDSTGRTKITDTTGISVNITLPLPDELREYAGNNRIAHISNNTLEDLGATFTTIDGVPCINFTATQFSPYVIYVDTANLTQGTITDTTPKTGDPIHPKWFLAIGMACISLILFFKKDKAAVKNKAA